MSSLLVINTPRNCNNCKINRICEHADYDEYDERPSECPLVEVPEPHNRLIDADELFLEFQTDEQMRLGEQLDYVRETIDNAPTVIEAERNDNCD